MSKGKDNTIDYTGAIQNLLYEHPLYDYISNEQVNILVLGYSAFSEKFIDFAFEMAQVSGYKLNISVVSENEESKDLYLSMRPSFHDFFSVDDGNVKGTYGSLTFKTVHFGNLEDDISELLLNDNNGKYAYLFIGSDDEAFNEKAADVCAMCRDLLDADFVINCVTESNELTSDINYLHSDDTIEKHKDYRLLKRMAFNCHLVWNDSQLLDMRKLQRQFQANYNFTACISYVISVKYKLKSIGIDFLDKKAPEKFSQLLNSKDSTDKEFIEDMIAGEHARWNVNMICRGFKTAKPDKYVAGKETKAAGYHPCLVIGTGVLNLSKPEWKNNNYEKWNDCSEEEWASLDSLDRVSVRLHREYLKQAEKIKGNNIISQADIDAIHKLLEGNIKVTSVFDKFYICLQEINAGNSSKTSLYEHYYSELCKVISQMPVQQSKIVRKRIDTLVASFSTILESEKYIDYKKYDADLIRKIPFILTYRSDLHISVPVDLMYSKTSVNTVAFRSLEAALIINPSAITYIFEYERKDFGNLVKILEYAVRIMDSHHLRSAINVCLLTELSLSERDKADLKAISKRINTIDEVNGENAFVSYAKRKRLRIFEFNRTRTSSIIEQYEYCNKSNYRYFRDTNKFDTVGCDEIKYLFFVPFLKISDIFEFKNSIDDYRYPDAQKYYSTLWKWYRGSETKWKALCTILGNYDKEENTTEIKNIDDKNILDKSYLVEKSCLDSVKKICDKVREVNALITYNVELYSNNTYNVSVNAPKNFHFVLLDLLCDDCKLCDVNNVTVSIGNRSAFIYYNSLCVNNVSQDLIKSIVGQFHIDYSAIKLILDKASQEGFIRKLKYENNSFSFVYSTHQIKEIMVAAGRILELHIFYKMIESQSFDSIASSVEIHWGNDEAENELDIIATKGYKVIIIEAKAQTKLDQDYYNKLSRLDSDYGLNSIPVIVADTLEKKEHAERNEKLMEIGNRVGIRTVYQKNAISNIGNTLANIINNTN